MVVETMREAKKICEPQDDPWAKTAAMREGRKRKSKLASGFSFISEGEGNSAQLGSNLIDRSVRHSAP
jgi:hypothetical protein